MTRDEKITEARRLRDQGWTYLRIGGRLGVTKGCVVKWLNPKLAREWDRAQNAKPERKAKKNAWTRAAQQNPDYKVPCVRCDGPTGTLTWHPVARSNRPIVCDKCLERSRDERRQLVARWWAEGLSMRDIAVRLGYTLNHLGVEMVRMRDLGYELEYRHVRQRKVAA